MKYEQLSSFFVSNPGVVAKLTSTREVKLEIVVIGRFEVVDSYARLVQFSFRLVLMFDTILIMKRH